MGENKKRTVHRTSQPFREWDKGFEDGSFLNYFIPCYQKKCKKYFGKMQASSEMIALAELFNCELEYLFSDKPNVRGSMPLTYWRHYKSNKDQEWSMRVFKLADRVRTEVENKPYLYDAIQEALNTTEIQAVEEIV